MPILPTITNEGINEDLIMSKVTKMVVFKVFLLSVLVSGCSPEEPQGTSIDGQTLQVVDRIRIDIERAPRIVLGEEEYEGNFNGTICRQIIELPDEDLRYRLFHELVDRVFEIKFESVGDIHSKDDDERLHVIRRLGMVYGCLERLVDEIQQQLMVKSAPPKEQFEPMFRFYEKMCLESRRRGGCNLGYSGKLNEIERMYGCALHMKTIPDEDFAWVRAKFQELAGRPIRTLEQADADRRAEWERQRRERRAAQKKGAARPAK